MNLNDYLQKEAERQKALAEAERQITEAQATITELSKNGNVNLSDLISRELEERSGLRVKRLSDFEAQKAEATKIKDSLLNRQVEIWSVSSSTSNSGLEEDYKKAATGVSLQVKRGLCFDEHLNKLQYNSYSE